MEKKIELRITINAKSLHAVEQMEKGLHIALEGWKQVNQTFSTRSTDIKLIKEEHYGTV
jgi:hypothetical protein